MAKSLAPEGAGSVAFSEGWGDTLVLRERVQRTLDECVERLGADIRGDARLRGWLSHLLLLRLGVVISLSRKIGLPDLEALVHAGRTAPHFREFSDPPWVPEVYTTDLPENLVFADADELYVAHLPDGGIRVCSPAEVEEHKRGQMPGVVPWVMTAEMHGWENADDLAVSPNATGSVSGTGEQTLGRGADHPEPLEGTPDWFMYQLLNPTREPDWESLQRWARRMVFHRGAHRHDPQKVRDLIAWAIREFLREHWQRFGVRLPTGLDTITFDELLDTTENWLADARDKRPPPPVEPHGGSGSAAAPAKKRKSSSQGGTADAIRRDALYKSIQALYLGGMRETGIVAHLATPEGKDLMAEVRWELERRPNTRGKPSRARVPGDVVAAALRIVFSQAQQPE